MPELVACPVCDCRILVNEMQLGRRIRCISCEQTFLAGEQTAAPEPTAFSLHPSERVDEPEEAAGRGRVPAKHRLPLCPRCHRPVDWKDSSCYHCSHLLEPEDRQEYATRETRRDALPHRGNLIWRLGVAALFGGALGICPVGVGALVAVGCGVPAWWMAQHDLAGMDAHRIDPAGRAATRSGRDSAVAGMILAFVFGACWLLIIVYSH